MPNTKSAEKRLRQDERKRLHNRSIKGVLKSQMKKVVAAVEEKDREKAEAEFRVATKLLDRAGLKRVLHPNTASRRKSALAKKINTIS